ncbi:calcium-binding protein [Nocardioides sp. MAHUQ-72]|uniref:calcium-binding protein n=1 Tax=unclassified Nocardioides TaxID=2615069 RepID=UPI00361C7AF1
MRVARGTLTALLLVIGTTTLVGEASAGAAPSGCPGATIVGTAGDDTLRGTEGDDVIDGRGGDDRVLGLGGDDVLCGGEGQDRLRGGPGSDTLHGGSDAKVAEDTDYYVYYGDVLDGGGGDDVLDPGTDSRHDDLVDTASWASSAQGVVVDLEAGTGSGDGTDQLAGAFRAAEGSAHDDVLLGSERDDALRGNGGSDRLEGRGGTDDLSAGTLIGGSRETVPNVLLGGSGGDLLDGAEGADELRGGRGKDLLQANGGADRSYGGRGDDVFNDAVVPVDGQVLDGGPGAHDDFAAVWFSDADGQDPGRVTGRLDLAAGTAVAQVQDAAVRVAATGFENASAPGGRRDRWTIIGTDGPNVLYAAWKSPVRIHAGPGADELYGSDGDDLLDGGSGRDLGVGWAGHDRYVSIERRR